MAPDRIDLQRLEATLGKPELQWLVDRLRRKLERGESVEGRIILSDPAPAQREAISRLFGRPAPIGGAIAVKLSELERLLRHGEICASLRDAVEGLAGPIRNLREEERLLEEHWHRLFDEGRDRARHDLGLIAWIDRLERSGLLRRLGGDQASAKKLLESAMEIAQRLPAKGIPIAELAALSTGDSHALDAGRPLASLIVELATDSEIEDRRDIWASLGVLCDELSVSVLTLNLVSCSAGTTARALRLHAEVGEPYRLSTRQLLREMPVFDAAEHATVYVCENPTVVAAAASRLGAKSAPIVCTEGQPRTACRLLLKRLTESGITLAYHGDFDWPGIQIANVIYRRHGFTPWRFSAADYRRESGSLSLTGAHVEASWDPDLSPAMIEAGHAIHEEQLLETLLLDLRSEDR
jgi:uncharacterized protein (TIGR02679 family)